MRKYAMTRDKQAIILFYPKIIEFRILKSNKKLWLLAKKMYDNHGVDINISVLP